MRMLPFGRREEPEAPPQPSFGEWLVRQFARQAPTESLTFAEAERVCSSAGSLLCAAAFADADAVGRGLEFTSEHVQEAQLIATRTGDGFQAALDDQDHTAITWPWDHLSTRIVWSAQRAGEATSVKLGRDLHVIGTTYAVAHREQLRHAIEFWDKVAGGFQSGATSPMDLVAMGSRMLEAFEAGATGG